MKPELVIVVAFDENGAIGKENQLLWHLPNDLKHFKSITSGFPIIMGRKTFESIGRLLPNRTNIILSRQKLEIPGAVVVSSMEDANASLTSDKLFVIGGGEIYKTLLPDCSTLEITKVHHQFDADTFFPSVNWEEWKMVWQEQHEADERHAFAYTFERYERK
jgi:dihydrofolate reductase